LVASLDGVEQSLLVTQQQMSAATVSASELTASNDVGELRRQLDSHDALMRDLASRDAQLQTTMSQAQTLDTNIAGKLFVSIMCVFYYTIQYTVFTCTQKLTNSQLNLPHGIKKRVMKKLLECGPMPNLMVTLPNIGGALCSTPQSLADAHY